MDNVLYTEVRADIEKDLLSENNRAYQKGSKDAVGGPFDQVSSVYISTTNILLKMNSLKLYCFFSLMHMINASTVTLLMTGSNAPAVGTAGQPDQCSREYFRSE